MRAPGDLTARELLSVAQWSRAADFEILRHMFAGIDFGDPEFDATGVRAAFTLVGAASTRWSAHAAFSTARPT
ncbi:MAG: hypothetical protein R3F11_28825 [Verrucomicrobiales bacterium]